MSNISKMREEPLNMFHIFLLVAIVVPSILLGYPFLGALDFVNKVNIYNVAFLVVTTK